ncbi:hypothetical protein FIBSPDRAFT_1012702 [Athelia psychrophila]|uniref:Uncharacterized protein n=1 Tax=Athelia psychrophila TaxID=1759441 RepID=A0A166VHM7_9AGAM|nr:hypothetical protein FIBSPDRAFT_1012702 [Fibularhizoctonia sp. CBS 109695]
MPQRKCMRKAKAEMMAPADIRRRADEHSITGRKAGDPDSRIARAKKMQIAGLCQDSTRKHNRETLVQNAARHTWRDTSTDIDRNSRKSTHPPHTGPIPILISASFGQLLANCTFAKAILTPPPIVILLPAQKRHAKHPARECRGECDVDHPAELGVRQAEEYMRCGPDVKANCYARGRRGGKEYCLHGRIELAISEGKIRTHSKTARSCALGILNKPALMHSCFALSQEAVPLEVKVVFLYALRDEDTDQVVVDEDGAVGEEAARGPGVAVVYRRRVACNCMASDSDDQEEEVQQCLNAVLKTSLQPVPHEGAALDGVVSRVQRTPDAGTSPSQYIGSTGRPVHGPVHSSQPIALPNPTIGPDLQLSSPHSITVHNALLLILESFLPIPANELRVSSPPPTWDNDLRRALDDLHRVGGF